MVSQGSFCDSDFVPDFLADTVDDDAMSMIKLRREVEDFPLLVSPPVEGVGGYAKQDTGFTVPSSSGGIPIHEGVVEDCSSDDEGHFLTDRDAIERDTIHRVAKAAFETNINDREELIRLKHKLMEVQKFLTKRGLSMAECEKDSLLGDATFNAGLSNPKQFVCGRDEFGLPKFTTPNSGSPGVKIKDAMSAGCDGIQVPCDEERMSRGCGYSHGLSGEGPSGVKNSLGQEERTIDDKKHSWSQVVRNAPPTNDLKFDYLPMPQGESVVCPPDEVLKEGIAKFKNSIVGTFSKAALSYSRVVEFAKSAWGKSGLLHVSQKSSHVFIFKFASAVQMSNVLSKGTWYIDSKPLLVHAWGTDIHAEPVKAIPLWIKLENIPDCYWTQKGPSYLASTIAPPLGADDLTSKLEILPFAKLCVNYTVGDELPRKINVTDLDPLSGEKRIVEVLVSYPARPLICSGCRAIGHIAGACPTTKRKWVLKVRPNSTTETHSNSDAQTPVQEKVTSAQPVNEVELSPEAKEPVMSTEGRSPGFVKEEEGWTKVERKRSFVHSPSLSVEESPPPLNTFKNLFSLHPFETYW
ncbi:hypothetical protein POM88_001131 [Heracleum sosnowskyi]|uniref:DUF4283 domain-containing protein n=1 Tax=Heracleum sosnowskyi TaxID=360622 RepID=A0AAD8JD44_9APIA|nr:hypothetical protein POM88_001131 [Heracleum sosnowskyi]